jgi:hypothetical protein
MKYKSSLFFFCFLSLFAAALYAQEAQEELPSSEVQDTVDETSEEAEADETVSVESRRIEMEIKTSTLSELAIWSRTLGLSEGGTRAELSKRIREHFKLPEPKTAEDNSQKIITIESAQTSEYFTIDIIGEDYARLRGDVRLTLKDGDTLHKISANEILFNRTRNIMTASGGVKYEKIDGDKTETFRGENITVNIDNWSSIFLGGSMEHTLESDGSAYLFSGEVISRNDEEVTIINNAVITSANSEESLWSIKASKLWLLPGSDFAVFNALLKVGEIPVLYIPFFHFPADEIFFHPVIGYQSRAGAFVQTTTYILGQPKASSSEESSITRILGNSNGMEKKLDGIFLRSTGKKVVDPNEISLRALIDYYVNLGTYMGLDLSVPRTGILSQLDFSIGFGITRTLSSIGTSYTPYAPNYDGTFDWNHSNFFSATVPFRYKIEFNSSISGKYGRLSWNFPYYSDSYIERDFMNRSESMDWMNMMQQGAAFSDSSTGNEREKYDWNVSGSLTPSFPKLTPWISRISISNFSTTLIFKRFEDQKIKSGISAGAEPPGLYFFAPDQYIIYNFSGSVAGTPVTIGGQKQKPIDTTVSETENDPLNGIGIPIPPWTNNENAAEKITSTDILPPPVLNQRFDLPGTENTKFIIDYEIKPASATELQFMHDNEKRWNSYDNVNWNDVQSILAGFNGDGNINFRIDHSKNLFTNAITFSGGAVWREYTFLNEEADIFQGTADPEQAVRNKRKDQYKLTNYTTSYAYNGTFNPLYEDPIFNQSNLQYNLRGTLAKSRRYIDGDGPELRPQWGAWEKEKLNEDILGLNSHRLSTKIAAGIFGKIQDITFGADLPPLDGLITTSANFRFWISETNINFRIEKPEDRNEWVYRPVNFNETLTFGKIGSFSHNMVLSPEFNNEITLIRSTLKLQDFTAEFIATRDSKYVFDPKDPNNPYEGGEWIQEGEPALFPKELKFSYEHRSSSREIIKNRMNLAFNITTSLDFYLQQHTDSNFELNLGFTANITRFLEITLSVTSRNAAIFRYFKNVPGMEDLTSMYREGDQNNLFIDLFDSFNFLDDSKRSRSGFKMQRLDLKAVHFLGDWTAELVINVYPYRRPLADTINTTTDISLLVQWKPITEIKSDIKYNGQYDRWGVK